MKHEAILAKLQTSLPNASELLKEAKAMNPLEIDIDYLPQTDEVIGSCSGEVEGNITDIIGGFMHGNDVFSTGAVQLPNPQCGQTFSSAFSSNAMQRYRGKRIEFYVTVVAEVNRKQVPYLGKADIIIPS